MTHDHKMKERKKNGDKKDIIKKNGKKEKGERVTPTFILIQKTFRKKNITKKEKKTTLGKC